MPSSWVREPYLKVKLQEVYGHLKNKTTISMPWVKSYFVWLSVLSQQSNCHVKILTDNMNAVYCIRNIGLCRSMTYNDVVLDILQSRKFIGFQYLLFLAFGITKLILNHENMNFILNGNYIPQYSTSLFRFIVPQYPDYFL